MIAHTSPTGDAEGKVYLGHMLLTSSKAGTQTFAFNGLTTVTGTDPLSTATISDVSGETSAFSEGVIS